MSAGAPYPKPIVLVPVRARQAVDRDTGPEVPNPIPLGLYESGHGSVDASARVGPVPPLAYFCFRTLINHADQVHVLGSHRIRCQPQVLRALSPSAFSDIGAATRCLCKLDPRLWSIVAQVYSDLPKGLRDYHIPLGDRHLPLLQAIPSTPSFALITVLSLAKCVSDETSHALKTLHGLCALDISQTSISHLGIRHFAPSITSAPPDTRYGTQGLRILRLCDCPKITNQVFGAVSNFQLLAVLDLRGTSCDHDLDSGVFRRSGKSQRNLFQCSLQDALQQLRDSDSPNILFSHPDPFVIHINTTFHPYSPRRHNRHKLAPGVSAFHPGVIPEAERELREWICLVLGEAANEARISEIADFVMQRWEYNPERLEPDDGCSRYHSDSGYPWEENDSTDSWDEESSSTDSRGHFCGYEVNEDLEEEVFEMAEEMREDHREVMGFYGSDPQASKTEICHCEELRGTAISRAETIPTDRHLMLVRDPPPWDSVYGPDAPSPRRIRLATKPFLSSSFNLHLDRSSTRARKSTQEMMGMIAQRRSLSTTATSSSLVSTQKLSTNPFRKDSNSGSVRGGSKVLHRGHVNTVQGSNPDSVPDGPPPKRVKCISQIPVPPRPVTTTESQSRRAKGSGGSGGKKPGKLKQTTLSGVFGKRT